MPKLSVVVPFFNMEDYLGECLESLARQTFSDLEVIMVDDGSFDGGTVVAKSWAERDSRFRLVRRENGGLGPARNTGIAHATGEYLAFVDSDDRVTPRAYELLVGALESSGSRFASGNVMRFDGRRVWQNYPQAETFHATRLGVSARDEPALLLDRICCNKVFRKSFWTECGFAFPATLYEDSPIVAQAYARADRVDVVSEHVYHWRVREGSITGRRFEAENAAARMRTALVTRESLAGSPELVEGWDRVVLDLDLGPLASAAADAGLAEAAALAEAGRAYLSKVADSVLAEGPARRRLRAFAVREGRMAELPELLGRSRIERRDGRWFAAWGPGVPDWVCEVTGELGAEGRVEDVRWAGDVLRITGRLSFGGWSPDLGDGVRLRMWLRHPANGRRIRVPARLDGLGFGARINVALLQRLGLLRRRTATWELHFEVVGRGFRREGSVLNPEPGRARWAPCRRVATGFRVQPIAGLEGRFLVQIRRATALVRSWRVVDGDLELSGWVAPGTPVVSVVARKKSGEGRVEGPCAVVGEGFVASLPLAKLDGAEWDVTLDSVKLALDCGEGYFARDGMEFRLTRNRYGTFRIVRGAPRLHVGRAEATDTGVVLTGESVSGYRPERILVRSRDAETACAVSWSGRVFRVVIPSGAVGDLVAEDQSPVTVDRFHIPELPSCLDVHAGDALRLVARKG